MIYDNIVCGKFIDRPNRFIANININGKIQKVHVKNTGRCKELLTKNAKVYCQEFFNTSRKTKFDLISVYKENKLINMDSHAPNKVVLEFLKSNEFIQDIKLIKPECQYKNSRFDFYVETKTEKIFIEVKGVTLEENGVVKFPDAPTLRGVKHINELIDATKNGYSAYVIFIVQMKDAIYFTPNNHTHPQFGASLCDAKDAGVNICAYCCNVTKNSLFINNKIEIKL